MFNFTEANESVYNILQQNQLLNILIAIVISAFVLFLYKNTGSKMLKQKALFLLLIIIFILNTRIPIVIIIIPICAILYILKFLMNLLCEYIQAKQNFPAQQTIQSSIGGQSNITSIISSTTSLSPITSTNRNGIFTIQMPSSESPYTQPSSANTSKSTSNAQIPYRLLPAVSNTPYTNYNYNQDISPGYSYNQPTTSRSTAKQTSAIHSILQPPTPLAQPVSRINTPKNVTRNVKDAANIVPYTTPLDLNEYSDLFNRKYDHDFQNYHRIIKSQTFYQAGKLYRRPYGCTRIGINLTRDRFAHEWIKNWHNAYHGTSEENVISIIKQGFKPGLGKYGEGVYCTPDHKLALKYAKGYFIYKGEPYRVVLQVRVKSAAYETVHGSNPTLKNEIWLLPKEKANKIRAYAICLFPVFPRCYHP